MRVLLKSFITFYQWVFAPFFGGQCRFYPSCSEYALEALHIHTPFRALYMILKRIGRCHPFHPGGVDLV